MEGIFHLKGSIGDREPKENLEIKIMQKMEKIGISDDEF